MRGYVKGYLTSEGGGGTNVLPTRQVDVDFGLLPVVGAPFLINDIDIVPASRILVQTALQPGIGKDSDEVEMETCLPAVFEIHTGGFRVFVKSLDGSYLEGTFKLNYQVSA
jgi:hypothetical protein